ncbi:hypothetical protein BGX29_008678 [Mortierella sp. GBA35]|nr:hypothetical protein BGX29_008678 [Mortierella sp. GBA35]
MMFSGATVNYFDAHIPILARHHPTVVRAMVKMANFLSGNGSSAGFLGGITLTVLAVLILSVFGTSSLALSYCLILSAVFVLTCMAAYGPLSHQRTSPPLPVGASYLTFGYVRIGRTVRQMHRLRTMFLYLCSWSILGDGLRSASIMTVLIAQEELRDSSSSLIVAVLIQYFFAAISMSFWANVSASWIGPLVCTGIIGSFGVRHTWWFLASQFYIGAFLMSFIDVKKGHQEATEFCRNEQVESKKAKLKRQHSGLAATGALELRDDKAVAAAAEDETSDV